MQLDPRKTALLLIDLQNGILNMPLAPRSGAEVLQTARQLAVKFRAAGAPVVLVNVGWSDDYADTLQQPVDHPTQRPAGGLPAGWSQLADGLAESGDLLITKRQWGAFHGTELDLQLRRRGISSIVLAGVASNFGVESTARFGWELGYHLVIAEDACTSFSAELHQLSMASILPRIAQVRQSSELQLAS
jgi:nicotinamidase-related amidase